MSGRRRNTAKTNSRNKNASSNTSTVRDFFRSQQNLQDIQNESFSSTSSFDSIRNGTMIDPCPELPQMLSALEARKESLDERKNEILSIKDEQIKKVLLGMVEDIRNVVEDSDKILKSHNLLLNKQNEDAGEIMMNRRSINNLTKGIGNLSDGLDGMKNRVQSLEVSMSSSFDSHFLNIVFVDGNEADSVESGAIGPKEKFCEILREMKIVPPKEIIDSHLMTLRRIKNGKRVPTKVLRTRFSNSLVAGRVFSQVIKHNKSILNENGSIKYYVEIPASKNVWQLKRICYEMKNEGTFVNVRGSDRGILVSYKARDPRDERKEIVKTTTVTSEKDIDDLRRDLKVDDAYIPIAKKYNEEFWNKKKKSDNTQKRGREHEENEDGNQIPLSKRPSSSAQAQ